MYTSYQMQPASCGTLEPSFIILLDGVYWLTQEVGYSQLMRESSVKQVKIWRAYGMHQKKPQEIA
jgi:hypothetical protein